MSTVAKAGITLTSVSDAYSVSLAPSVCVIHADFDGSNPVLTNAYTLITVYCGEQKVPFSLEGVSASSDKIQYESKKTDDYTVRLSILALSTEILEGSISFGVVAGNDVHQSGKFQFTVERESTMLDWIQAWENGKTSIGGNSIITPRLFVGKKITGSYDSLSDVSGLTGVYIGPSANDGCGIYGYKNSVDIFHLDENGGHIGGWDILQDGLYSINGQMRILSNGTVQAINEKFDVLWEVCSDGSARFALGNVQFSASGDASFRGHIYSSSGQIASWTIADNQLHCVPIGISGKDKYIAIANVASYPTLESGGWDGNHLDWVQRYGGVALYYRSRTQFGLVGYNPSGTQVFSVGATSSIAGWEFDQSAMWLGDKNNNADQYTTEGSITIGTNGLRGQSWYIDKDGTASFAKGLFSFELTSGQLVGWCLSSNKLSTDQTAIVSSQAGTGIYMTAHEEGHFTERGVDAMASFIAQNGGFYLRVVNGSSDFTAYNEDGTQQFQLSSGHPNYIAGWYFTASALYTGTLTTEGFTSQEGDITLGPSGIRGAGWRLETDGSGAIAGGKISWDHTGKISFASSVLMDWGEVNNKFTHIDANGIYTGTIQVSQLVADTIDASGIYTGTLNANQIVAGTIDAQRIQSDTILSNGDAWGLNKDGSGFFANGQISWDTSGNACFSGQITASSGDIAGWSITDSQIRHDHLVISSAESMVAVSRLPFSEEQTLSYILRQGGVQLYYTSDQQYGIVGYAHSGHRVFSIGSENHLGGWYFDDEALWTGSKNNQASQYTTSGSITIGNNGLRGQSWYIDSDGTAVFSQGLVQFASDHGQIAGWTIASSRFATSRIALVSDDVATGLYLTSYNEAQFVQSSPSELSGEISAHGGIYLQASSYHTRLACYNASAQFMFGVDSLGNGQIAGWKFDHDTLYTGTPVTSGFSASGTITLGPSGIRGAGWRLETDGSGAIAGGKISWDHTGKISFASSVLMDWGEVNNKFTHIDANGIYTGTLSADHISAGTLSTVNIRQSSGVWYLNQDGTGALAGGNIRWGADGSGQIAGGNISWDASGNVQFSHAVSLVWEQGTDAARLIANGKMLYRDPEFSNLLQYNGTHLYLKSYTSRRMVQDSSVPHATRHAMRYTCTQWNAYSDWRLGGFYFANPSRPNGVYVVRIVAKIPSLWKIENYHNSYGTDGHTVWVTPQAGTDRYQEYVCIVTCGSSGNFDLINHFALTFNETEHYTAYTAKNSSSDLGIYYLIKSTGRIVQLTTVVWDVAYATVYDATAIEQFHTTIDANGIYTGTLNAGQITAGTIDATRISAETILSNGEAWSLKKDGSGHFANRHISWDADGNVRCNSGTFENVNISGNGDITGFVRKRATIITPLNINDYVFNGSGSKKRIDFMKTGSLIVFSNAIDSNGNEVDFSSIGYIVIEFPSCQYQTASDAEYYDAAMLYVGSTAIISISASNLSIRIDGVTQRKESEGYIDTIMTLDLPTISAEGRIIFMRCFGAPVNDPSTLTRGGGYAVAWSYNYVASFKSNRCPTIQEDPWTLSKLPPSLVN